MGRLGDRAALQAAASVGSVALGGPQDSPFLTPWGETGRQNHTPETNWSKWLLKLFPSLETSLGLDYYHAVQEKLRPRVKQLGFPMLNYLTIKTRNPGGGV